MRKLPFQNISEKEKKNFGNTMSMYVGFKKTPKDVYTAKEAIKKVTLKHETKKATNKIYR